MLEAASECDDGRSGGGGVGAVVLVCGGGGGGGGDISVPSTRGLPEEIGSNAAADVGAGGLFLFAFSTEARERAAKPRRS